MTAVGEILSGENELIEHIIKSERIFLSVDPVVCYTDVLLAMQSLIKEKDNTLDVVSVKGLSAFAEDTSVCKAGLVIVACGDVTLTEMPAYLRREVIETESHNSNANIFSHNWLMMRVHVSTDENHVVEILDSNSLPEEAHNVSGERWKDNSALLNYLEKMTVINCSVDDEQVKRESEDHNLTRVGIKNLYTFSDLEFVD